MASIEEADLGAVQQDRSLKAQIFKSLRSAIVDGRMAAGTLYSVQSLATTLNVSRTPVREALIDLEARGMVAFERNQGVRVLETSLHDLKEILTLRFLLEVPAAARAAQLIDDAGLETLRPMVEDMERLNAAGEPEQVLELDREFHRRIMAFSGNQRLAQYVDHLRDLMLMRGIYSSGAQKALHQHIGQHRGLYDALAKRDPAATAEAMRAHLIATAHDLLVREGDDPESTTDWADLLAVVPSAGAPASSS